MFADLELIALCALERAGRRYEPGELLRVPFAEGDALIRAGLAAPLGAAELQPQARPIVGRFRAPRAPR